MCCRISQVVDRIEEHDLPGRMERELSGNDPGAATDNHLADIATVLPDFLMAVGVGHGIVIRPVEHQGQRVDPRALLRRTRRTVPAVASSTLRGHARTVRRCSHGGRSGRRLDDLRHCSSRSAIAGVPAREPGKRRHEVPPGIADRPLHIAFVVTLVGTNVAVLEEVMGLQPAERKRSLPAARDRQDARHLTLVVVVKNRLTNAAESSKASVVSIQNMPPSLPLDQLAGIEAGIAVGKCR